MNPLAISYLLFGVFASDISGLTAVDAIGVAAPTADLLGGLTETIQHLFNDNKKGREVLVKDTVEKAFYGAGQGYNVLVCTNYAYYM